MQYVDGFVLPVPKKKMALYRQMAAKASKVWKKHGALNYYECALEDSKAPFALPFPKGIKAKAGETVVFAYIVYKSRAHRDRVNAKVMKDPGMCADMDPNNMPFDCKRMLYGGFDVIVNS